MLDKKKRKELEDEHALKLREIERVETELDAYYYKFDRETNKLLDAISYACREVPCFFFFLLFLLISSKIIQHIKNFQKISTFS